MRRKHLKVLVQVNNTGELSRCGRWRHHWVEISENLRNSFGHWDEMGAPMHGSAWLGIPSPTFPSKSHSIKIWVPGQTILAQDGVTPSLRSHRLVHQLINFLQNSAILFLHAYRKILWGRNSRCRRHRDFPLRTQPGLLQTLRRRHPLCMLEEFSIPPELVDRRAPAVAASGAGAGVTSCDDAGATPDDSSFIEGCETRIPKITTKAQYWCERWYSAYHYSHPPLDKKRWAALDEPDKKKRLKRQGLHYSGLPRVPLLYSLTHFQNGFPKKNLILIWFF